MGYQTNNSKLIQIVNFKADNFKYYENSLENN